MKKINLVLLASLLLLPIGFAPPLLAAAVADFQGQCTASSPTMCVYDATRTSTGGPGSPTSCAPSTVSIYFWDFDSNLTTDDKFTSNSFESYTYPGAYCDFVKFAVFCANGTSATRNICLCNTVGIGGCIRPGAGWTP